MTNETMTERDWVAQILRIGNKAVREAQAQNRAAGIANWYSLNGRLVSDQGDVDPEPAAADPEAERAA